MSQQDNRVNSGCCFCFVGQTEVWEVRGEERLFGGAVDQGGASRAGM